MEQEAAEITSTEAEDVGEAHEQAPEVGAPLGAVPEGDEAVDDGNNFYPIQHPLSKEYIFALSLFYQIFGLL